MNPQQTARSYDQLASHWNGAEFNRQNGIAQHERAFQFLSNKRTAIDVGCGSSGRVIDLLLAEGFEVEGLDISAEMIRLAKQRHPDVVFHHEDILTRVFAKKYDFISAWDSIWHVPLERQEELLGKLCDALSPGGVLIFTSGGVDGPGEVTNPCQGQPLYHAAPGISKLLEIISGKRCVCRHLEYDQHPELHIYLVIQKTA